MQRMWQDAVVARSHQRQLLFMQLQRFAERQAAKQVRTGAAFLTSTLGATSANTTRKGRSLRPNMPRGKDLGTIALYQHDLNISMSGSRWLHVIMVQPAVACTPCPCHPEATVVKETALGSKLFFWHSMLCGSKLRSLACWQNA